MKKFCEDAIAKLNSVSTAEWANTFVELRMEFHRKFSRGIITSTWHGTDFFNNVLFCLNGGDVNDLKEPVGEYRTNFKKIIDIGKQIV
jgi:hypothetical protein